MSSNNPFLPNPNIASKWELCTVHAFLLCVRVITDCPSGTPTYQVICCYPLHRCCQSVVYMAGTIFGMVQLVLIASHSMLGETLCRCDCVWDFLYGHQHTYIRMCVCVPKVTVFGTSLCDLLRALESQEWVYYSSTSTYIGTYVSV